MRRAHSVSDMKKALIRRTANEDLIQKVLARLKQNGLIDDARYAKQFARQRTEITQQGKYRAAPPTTTKAPNNAKYPVPRDLRAPGVPDHPIKTAVTESSANSDEAAMVR